MVNSLAVRRRSVRLAAKSVLDKTFPTSAETPGCSDGGATYFVEDLDLTQLVVERHLSQYKGDDGNRDRNRDPDVSRRLGEVSDEESQDDLEGLDGNDCMEEEESEEEEEEGDVSLSEEEDSNAGFEYERLTRPVFPNVATSGGMHTHGTTSRGNKKAQSSADAPTDGSQAWTGPAPTTAKGKRKARSRKRRDATFNDKRRKTEEYRSKGGLNAQNYRFSKTGWMGSNYRRTTKGKELVQAWKTGEIVHYVKDFERIAYTAGLQTRVRDKHGRMFLLRTYPTERVQRVLPSFLKEVATFVQNIEQSKTGFKEAEMEANARGPHWFSIMGHDRNNKQEPALSAWHKKNEQHISELIRPGGPVAELTKIMETIFTREFPEIAKRYKDCATKLKIKPLFGPFFNFCINWPRYYKKIMRVHCFPHIDWKNLAIGICIIFVFGHFNSEERSWLVIWEAGIIIELPAGVFVMYPSSLFFHYNIDVCDLPIVVTSDGQRPTQDNSTPLSRGEGRGSCVYFNQASMFQAAELGVSTVAQAKKKGMATTSDPQSWLNKNAFPKPAY